MAENDAPAPKAAQKPRVKKAIPYDAEAVAARIAADAKRSRKRFYLRAAIAVPAVALLLVAVPFVLATWNLLRPDAPASARVYLDTADTRALDAALNAAAGEIGGLAGAHEEFTESLVTGHEYDAEATPAFLESVDGLPAVANLPAALADRPTSALAALAALDGVELARLAHRRTADITAESAAALRATHRRRLELARCRVTSADSPAALDTALTHLAGVLAEMRLDRARLTPGTERDTALLAALAEAANPPKAAAEIAARFDRALDLAPDATLARMQDDDPHGLFEKLLRLGRRPHAHRQRITELHRRFGDALARPTHGESLRALAPEFVHEKTRRLAAILLRDATLARLGDDYAIQYYFESVPAPDRDFDRFLLKFAAVASADDAYGEALLSHRRAVLLKLVAKHQRLRFECAATAYALALEYRRSLADGKWPKSTEGLLDGLLDTYPADPFTGEPVAYSRKRLQLTSPGADGVSRGGLEEPEFASELMQLWEPTVALEPDPEPSPAAFGLNAAEMEKPVPRPWEIQPKKTNPPAAEPPPASAPGTP